MTLMTLHTRCEHLPDNDPLRLTASPFVIQTTLSLLTKIVGLPLIAIAETPAELAARFPPDEVPQEAESVFGRDRSRYRSWRQTLLDALLIHTKSHIDTDDLAGLRRLSRLFIRPTAVNPLYYIPKFVPCEMSVRELSADVARSIDSDLSGQDRVIFRALASVLDHLQDVETARATGLLPREKLNLPKSYDHFEFIHMPEQLRVIREQAPRNVQNALDFCYRFSVVSGLLVDGEDAALTDLTKPSFLKALRDLDPAEFGFQRPSKSTFEQYIKRMDAYARRGVHKRDIVPDDPIEAAWWQLSKFIRDHFGKFPDEAVVVRKLALTDGLAPGDLTHSWFRTHEGELEGSKRSQFRRSAFFYDRLQELALPPDLEIQNGCGLKPLRRRKKK